MVSVLSTVASTPPVTKTLTAILFSLSSIHLYLRLAQPTQPGLPQAPYLTVVPGSSFWYPWTFITAGFVEVTLLEMLFSVVVLAPSLRYFERIWGSIETIKFVLIVLIISNIIAFFANWLEYIATGYAETFLYNQEYRGQMALQAAFLVAFTQLIPEHQLQLFGSVKLRVKRLPMIYVTISTVACLVGFQAPFLLIQLGWLVSWTYLRFYKRTTADTPGGVEVYGDRSETFAFIHWFPPFLHYPIGLLSNAAYRLALRVKLIRPFPNSASDIEGGYSTAPGGTRAEAERRRALALKALDQRLASNVANANSISQSTAEEVSKPTSKPPRQPPNLPVDAIADPSQIETDIASSPSTNKLKSPTTDSK